MSRIGHFSWRPTVQIDRAGTPTQGCHERPGDADHGRRNATAVSLLRVGVFVGDNANNKVFTTTHYDVCTQARGLGQGLKTGGGNISSITCDTASMLSDLAPIQHAADRVSLQRGA